MKKYRAPPLQRVGARAFMSRCKSDIKISLIFSMFIDKILANRYNIDWQ